MTMQVIDNFLPHEQFVCLRDAIMGTHFGWFFQSNVAGEVGDPRQDFYLAHMLYETQRPTSDWYPIIVPLLERLDVKALFRAKANLYPNVGFPQLNAMHTDEPWSHRGAVFSINTNNGFTMFEDGTKVQSVENRVLIFDPSERHCSAHCTDEQRRVNINLNFF